MVDGDVEAVDETTLVIVDWPAEDEEIVDGEDEGETFEGFCIFGMVYLLLLLKTGKPILEIKSAALELDKMD